MGIGKMCLIQVISYFYFDIFQGFCKQPMSFASLIFTIILAERAGAKALYKDLLIYEASDRRQKGLIAF